MHTLYHQTSFRSTQLPAGSQATLHGFTLVELLVIVTLIAILISLLVPAIDRGLISAQRAMCATNERLIIQVTMQYAFDQRGMLPPGRQIGVVENFGEESVYTATPHFLGSLIPRFGGIRKAFICPSIPRYTVAPYIPTDNSDTAYMGNGAVYERRLSRIDNLSGVVFLNEIIQRYNLAWYRPWGDSAGLYQGWHYNTFSLMPGQEAHAGHDIGTPKVASNHVFGDGHVEYRLARDWQAGDFGLVGGTGASGQASDTVSDPDNFTYRPKYD